MSKNNIIFIVDDEEYNRDIAARLVKKMGYTAQTYASGKTFLKAFQEEAMPAMVLLDIHMPEMNGLEVLSEIREYTDKTELPVLMITADSDADSVVNAFNIGANDYVTKPINSKTLRARIETHMQLRNANIQIREFAEGAELVVATTSLDLQKRNEDLAREVHLRMEAEAELIDQKVAIERENLAKSEFLTNLATELNTPLNVNLGFSDLIADDKDTTIGIDQAREYAAYISKSTTQLLAIISDILAVTSHETGIMELHETNVNLRDIITNGITRARPSHKEKNITINIDCDDNIAISCDRKKMIRVITCLISNAIKFSNTETQIDIETKFLDNFETKISIIDHGKGMLLEDHNDLMTAFKTKSDRQTRKTDGLGLGLPASQAILKQHDASLDIQSTPDIGTTVTIRIPAARAVIFTDEKIETTITA